MPTKGMSKTDMLGGLGPVLGLWRTVAVFASLAASSDPRVRRTQVSNHRKPYQFKIYGCWAWAPDLLCVHLWDFRSS